MEGQRGEGGVEEEGREREGRGRGKGHGGREGTWNSHAMQFSNLTALVSTPQSTPRWWFQDTTFHTAILHA